jgi:CheY-like chemotaxis protein
MNPDLRPILLVEDNPMDIDLTIRAFTRNKITNPIQVARDGAEVKENIHHWEAGEPRPMFILLDLKLPGISGLEILQLLKGHPLFRPIPVTILTSSNEDSDIQNAYLYGANSYVVKPIDFVQFMQAVAQIVHYWNVINQLPGNL